MYFSFFVSLAAWLLCRQVGDLIFLDLVACEAGLFNEFSEYYFGDLVSDGFFFEFGVKEVFFEGFDYLVFVDDYVGVFGVCPCLSH